MSKNKNVIVAQSGGPTAVINGSVEGVIEVCQDHRPIGTVYAGYHGIEGVLKEELIDLSAQDPAEIALLRVSPAAGAIGTCRYKLKESQTEDFQRVIDVFRAHNIGYFFYCGGNDSMDTANKISDLAREQGLELRVVGISKTIDNDVGGGLNPDGRTFALIDHTPGYGSCAKYWAWKVSQWNEENKGSCPSDPVLVVQAMGRKIGFIPAAARLADPNREMPLVIVLGESNIALPDLYERIHDTVKEHGRAIVIVSEGYDAGNICAAKDGFGHTEFGTGTQVAQVVTEYINQKGLPVPGNARFQVPGTDQRNDHLLISGTDLEEAWAVGAYAVAIALEHGGGFMSTLLRDPGEEYHVHAGKVPLEQVANSERTFPASWIAANKVDVTDDFVRYASPLIGGENIIIPVENGLPRFARLNLKLMAEQKLAQYTPQAYRK